MLNCFRIRGSSRRLLSSPLIVVQRLPGCAAAPLVMRQSRDVIVDLVSEPRLHCLCNMLVEEFASLEQYRVIGDLLRECVLENVLCVSHGGLLIDELPKL